MRARPYAKALQRECDDFNARCSIGDTVTVRRDGGGLMTTTTRSRAEVLSGHTAVIWVQGIAGCYALERVTPVAGSRA